MVVRLSTAAAGAKGKQAMLRAENRIGTSLPLQ